MLVNFVGIAGQFSGYHSRFQCTLRFHSQSLLELIPDFQKVITEVSNEVV